MLDRQVIIPGIERPCVQDEMLDLSSPLAFAIAEVMSVAECAAIIAKIEQLGPEAAPITTTAGFVMRPELRNNTRVMFDDAALAAELFARIGGALPARLFGRGPVGVNERFRCYRYEPGQRFAPHYDGAFRRSPTEASELTLMVYLNDGFTGGRTTFLDYEVALAPPPGAALLFQHRLLHEGSVVTAGIKYVLRSDVMYAA